MNGVTRTNGAYTNSAFGIQPRVAMRDIADNIITQYNGTNAVILSVVAPANATRIGSSTANVVNGIATFSNYGLLLSSSAFSSATVTLRAAATDARVPMTLFVDSMSVTVYNTSEPAQVQFVAAPNATQRAFTPFRANSTLTSFTRLRVTDSQGRTILTEGNTVSARVFTADGSVPDLRVNQSLVVGNSTELVSNGTVDFSTFTVSKTGLYRVEFYITPPYTPLIASTNVTSGNITVRHGLQVGELRINSSTVPNISTATVPFLTSIDAVLYDFGNSLAHALRPLIG